MKLLLVLLLLVSLKVHSSDIDDLSYIGVHFGSLDTNELELLEYTFGNISSSTRSLCARDKDKTVTLSMDNDSKHDMVRLLTVTLDVKLESSCLESKTDLPTFSVLEAGQYQLDLEKTLMKSEYSLISKGNKSRVYSKRIMGVSRCRKVDDEYEGAFYLYGRDVNDISYTLSKFSGGRVGRIQKSLVYNFEGDVVESCKST